MYDFDEPINILVGGVVGAVIGVGVAGIWLPVYFSIPVGTVVGGWLGGMGGVLWSRR